MATKSQPGFHVQLERFGPEALKQLAELDLEKIALQREANRLLKEIRDSLQAASRMAKALRKIVAMRDRMAEGLALPDGYECFDDWAADLASAALEQAA